MLKFCWLKLIAAHIIAQSYLHIFYSTFCRFRFNELWALVLSVIVVPLFCLIVSLYYFQIKNCLKLSHVLCVYVTHSQTHRFYHPGKKKKKECKYMLCFFLHFLFLCVMFLCFLWELYFFFSPLHILNILMSVCKLVANINNCLWFQC